MASAQSTASRKTDKQSFTNSSNSSNMNKNFLLAIAQSKIIFFNTVRCRRIYVIRQFLIKELRVKLFYFECFKENMM